MERFSGNPKPVQKYEWPTPDCGATPSRAVIIGRKVVEEAQVVPVQIDRKTGRIIGHR